MKRRSFSLSGTIPAITNRRRAASPQLQTDGSTARESPHDLAGRTGGAREGYASESGSLRRRFALLPSGVFTIARRSKIAHREVNRRASPHIERAWRRVVIYTHAGMQTRSTAHDACPFLQEGAQNARCLRIRENKSVLC